MREWELTADSPLALRFAADARLASYDPADDQVWEIALGDNPERPALSVQSVLGARVGLARIDTLWGLPEGTAYATGHFAAPYTVRSFAPNYARLTARLTPTLSVTFELWVMAPRAVGGRYTVQNESGTPIDVQLDAIGQIARESAKVTPRLNRLDDGLEIIALGRLPGMTPALLLEGAQESYLVQGSIPKLSTLLTVPANGSTSRKWVHAGFASLEQSVSEGRKLLSQADWDAAFDQIRRLSAQCPQIDTGDTATDAALAFGLNTLLRSVGGPTRSMPGLTLIGARSTAGGYHPAGSAAAPADHTDWPGPTPALLWMGAPTLAAVEPRVGKAALEALLSSAATDGWIDNHPGLGGQRSSLLAFPVLASTALALYETTGDTAFLERNFPRLRSFFERWFAPDADADRDGAPEWRTPAQAAQPEHPLFNRFRRWAANAEISKAETPDLIAILLHEGEALLQMAQVLNVSDTGGIQARMTQLGAAIQAMWSDAVGIFMPRDRDTHQPGNGQILFSGKGDTWLAEPTPLSAPSRLLLRVVGGQAGVPKMSARVEGLDQHGAPVTEAIPLSGFVWYYGLGSALTEHLYSEVRFARVEGLSRVFQVEIEVPSLAQGADQYLTNLVPLWAGADPDQAARLIASLRDPALWAHRFGLPLSRDAALGDDNPNRAAPMFWNCILLEALLARGSYAEAQSLITRLLAAQVQTLRTARYFSTAYQADTGAGVGIIDDPLGILPLHLVLKSVGVLVRDQRSLWAGGPFLYPNPVTVTQYGVRVTRSASGTEVLFPSGYTVRVDGRWQLVEDPTAAPSLALVAPPAALPVAPPAIQPAGEPPGVAGGPAKGSARFMPEGELSADRPGAAPEPRPIPVQKEPLPPIEIPLSSPGVAADAAGAPPAEEPPKTYRIKVRRA